VVCVQLSAQKTTECTPVPPDKSLNLNKNDFCFRIDTSNATTQGLRQPNVISGDLVYIQLVRKPVEKCSIALKTEAITPPPSGFATFLKTVKIAGEQTKKDDCQALADATAPPDPKTTEVGNFEKDGGILQLITETLNARIKQEQDLYQDAAKRVVSFGNCKDFTDPTKGICDNDSTFAAKQAELVEILDKLLSSPIPTSSLADFQMTKLKSDLDAIPKASPWFVNKAAQYACYDAYLAGIKAHLKDVSDGRQQFVKIVEVIRGLDWPTAKLKLIPPQKNAKVTATVSCTNVVSGDASIDPVNVIVFYTDVPKVSSTVGVLLTLTPKQVIGINAVSTGVSNGVPTYKNVFAVTSSAPVQVVPFTFLNVRVHYWRFRENIFSLNAAGGIGVNPNSGSNQVEYFAGTSFGIGSLYIDFGAHFGEFQNLGGGFYLGQTVPSGLTKAPVTTKYTIHPSFGFTYKLPLP
jgi:hypothetical protein